MEMLGLKMRGYRGRIIDRTNGGMIRLAFPTRPLGYLYRENEIEDQGDGTWKVL